MFGHQKASMILYDLIETFLRGIEGRIGRYLRYGYYKMRLKQCGRGVVIDSGVHIIQPSMIELGDRVWIDRNAILIAGKIETQEKNFRTIQNPYFKGQSGEIHIGSYSHIGIGTIIQGHGGVFMDHYCTTSAGCKIYSFSNDPERSRKGTMIDTAYIVHPVMVEENVWLGLNTIVLGHHIGKNSFVKPNSVIYKDVSADTIYDGVSDQSIPRNLKDA